MSVLISLSIAVGVSGVLFAVGQSYFARRLRQLKAERQGEDFGTFEQAFSGEGLSREDLYHVYRFFQRWVGDDHFPVRATDSITDIYGIVDDDVGRMMRKLAEVCGSGRPQVVPEIDRVKTVRDVARMVARQSC